MGRMKYLSLIQAIVLLHDKKHSKQKKNNDIQQFEVTRKNISLASKLAHETLGRTLQNLAPQTRLLLLLIEEMVDTNCAAQGIKRIDFRFVNEDIKKYVGWGKSELKRHLHQLVQKGYIHQVGKIYELLYHGKGKKIEYFLTRPVI